MAPLRYTAKFDPFLSLAWLGEEGIKFCHLATMIVINDFAVCLSRRSLRFALVIPKMIYATKEVVTRKIRGDYTIAIPQQSLGGLPGKGLEKLEIFMNKIANGPI